MQVGQIDWIPTNLTYVIFPSESRKKVCYKKENPGNKSEIFSAKTS